jgi:membrane protease subunit HflK
MRIQIGNEIIELKTPDIKGKAIVGIAFAILLVAAILTSFYTVKVEEEGVVMRFGKHVDTVSPGLHFKMPFGIDQVIPVPTKRQLTQEFGFETAQGARNFYKHTNAREMEFEKNMVTGDLNAVLVEWVVQYHIAEADNFLFRVRDPDETLRDASESIMRQIVGDRTVDEVITVGRQEIGDQSEVMLQELIALYGLGFEVDQVQLLNVDPPTPVQASFIEVK